MRHYDIPYVKNVAVYYPPINLQDLTLQEIKEKFIKLCGKANGDISVCSKCPTPCNEGKRAIQLAANQVYSDPPVPLYGGKTLIERAREENAKRREEKKEEPAFVAKVKKGNRIYIDGWYEKAKASDDPVAWVMNAYGISRTKAKQKIYEWRNRHPEEKEVSAVVPNIEEKKEEKKVKTTEPSIESKFDELMKLQEEHKKAMTEYLKLYEQAKIEYEKIKAKTDILCSALDIMNNN